MGLNFDYKFDKHCLNRIEDITQLSLLGSSEISEMSKQQESISTITVETLILILNRILDELQTPSNVQKLEEARDNVGNEMLKMMQYLFPIVMQIQMEIIKDYGFCEGREGIIKFAQLLRNMERDDAEISRLHNLIKSHYLPPVNVNTCSELPTNDRITNN